MIDLKREYFTYSQLRLNRNVISIQLGNATLETCHYHRGIDSIFNYDEIFCMN